MDFFPCTPDLMIIQSFRRSFFDPLLSLQSTFFEPYHLESSFFKSRAPSRIQSFRFLDSSLIIIIDSLSVDLKRRAPWESRPFSLLLELRLLSDNLDQHDLSQVKWTKPTTRFSLNLKYLDFRQRSRLLISIKRRNGSWSEHGGLNTLFTSLQRTSSPTQRHFARERTSYF